MENKKAKAKSYYQANKEKLQERSQEYCRNLSEDMKIKKTNYTNNGYENTSDEDSEKKGIYEKIFLENKKRVKLSN